MVKPEAGRERERRPGASRNSVSPTERSKPKQKEGFTSFPYRDKEVLMAGNEFRN